MVHALRQFLFGLIAFAFLGGNLAQLAHSAEHGAPMMMAGMPCTMMTMAASGMQGPRPMPCKGMADCKQMGCVADAAVPSRAVHLVVAVGFCNVDYWSAWSHLADFTPKPEPFPPRTL